MWTLRKSLTMALALLLAGVGAAASRDYTAGALRIGQPWSRATPNSAKVAGGYLSITNTGTEPDTLTGGSFARAGQVEVHRMSMEGGVMKMAPVAGGLVIKPGETVTLAPGGYHMMFTGLTQGLKQGETVAGTLTFAKAGTVAVEFVVEAIAAQAPGAGAQQHVH